MEKYKKSKLKNFNEQDYYELFDYKDRAEVELENLRNKYKKLALLFHPDKNKKRE